MLLFLSVSWPYNKLYRAYKWHNSIRQSITVQHHQRSTIKYGPLSGIDVAFLNNCPDLSNVRVYVGISKCYCSKKFTKT